LRGVLGKRRAWADGTRLPFVGPLQIILDRD
jgi:hypothetical protein